MTEWRFNENKHTVELSFRKKGNIRNIVGIITSDTETNAVDLKKKITKRVKI